MKTMLTKVLILCLMAITLHGFGTDEHVFKAQKADITIASTDIGKDKSGDNIPNLGAACDICEVVHQYVTLENNLLLPVQPAILMNTMPMLLPPGRTPGRITRPPTI
ncbi:MAG: hypothetical protein Q9M45_02340 [Robiginitomaculum sp.]|nr:hypothetical protein [Robiginitomaculum sp.]